MPINTDFTVHADSKPQILRLIIRNHILLLKAAMPMYIHEHEEWCPFRGTNEVYLRWRTKISSLPDAVYLRWQMKYNFKEMRDLCVPHFLLE